MITPHSVSLINIHHDVPFLTILHGVMLQALDGQAVQLRGDIQESNARLFIPFSVSAVNAAGESVSFLPPLEYARCADPENHWTLQPEGESAGRCSFFIKGEIPEACSLAFARDNYDFVCTVAGFYLHDYGSSHLQHYEVLSKVASRFYQYN